MKQFLYLLLLTVAIGGFSPRSASAQCTYKAKKDGPFSAASTWDVTSTGNAPCNGTPLSGSDARILISKFNVVLDVPFALGQQGSLTIADQGSLMGGSDLAIGDGTGNRMSTWLKIEPGSTLRVAQLLVNKGFVLINSAPAVNSLPATLTTDCNLVLTNAVVTDNSQVFINGSVDVSSGSANNELCGSGSMRIVGCVYGGNGAVRKMAANCASALVMNTCAQMAPPPTCALPRAGNNANERACDALVARCQPLPVVLVLFTASLTPRQGVALHWVTASEKNSKHFVIERSADGTTFSPLRTVAAAGTTQARTTYDQTDEQPLFGTSYYRLRQVDLDGATSFSPVQSIRLGSANGEALAVYPGHEAQQWVVSTSLPAAVLASSPASVRVSDGLGRSQAVAALPEGSQTGRWTLDMRSLPAGLYIVRLVSAAGSFSQRIVQ